MNAIPTTLMAMTLLIACLIGGKVFSEEPQWVIVLHGGAGHLPRDLSAERRSFYHDRLRTCLGIGESILREGGTALDAVEKTIVALENDPLFNAGKGAVFTSAAAHELDASIMDGATLDCGGVAGVSKLKNPIRAARILMQNSPHVLLAGPQADQFAIQHKCETVNQEYYFTQLRWNELLRTLASRSLPLPERPAYGFPTKTTPSADNVGEEVGETVGCVALDQFGHLAAGTSTGGLTGKTPGRVGDSPIIGAGTYANDRSCAVSATGLGEQYIRHSIAAKVSWFMENNGATVDDACRICLEEILNPGDGGLIAVDALGNVSHRSTTGSMPRGIADSTGRFEVFLWEEPLEQPGR